MPKVFAALAAGALDEVVVHRVPVLLGGGTPLFPPGCRPARLELTSVVTAPDVTHLTYSVVRASTG